MQNKKAKDDGFNIRHPTLDNILNQQKNNPSSMWMMQSSCITIQFGSVLIQEIVTLETLQLNLLPVVALPLEPGCPTFLNLTILPSPELVAFKTLHSSSPLV